jgi:hypothetical protein
LAAVDGGMQYWALATAAKKAAAAATFGRIFILIKLLDGRSREGTSSRPVV